MRLLAVSSKLLRLGANGVGNTSLRHLCLKLGLNPQTRELTNVVPLSKACCETQPCKFQNLASHCLRSQTCRQRTRDYYLQRRRSSLLLTEQTSDAVHDLGPLR